MAADQSRIDIQEGVTNPKDVNTQLWYEQVKKRVERDGLDARQLLQKLIAEGATERHIQFFTDRVEKENDYGREGLHLPNPYNLWLAVSGVKAGSEFQVVDDDGTGPMVNWPYPHFD